jgi:hypothetical protein
MRVHAIGGLAVGALLALSCGGSIRPVAIHEGDQCFRCRRPIVEKATAAEMIDGTLASKFRAPGCMAKYLVEHPGETGTTFVTDFATGKWVRPDQASFVPVVVNPNTGETDYHAFLNKADADAAAAGSHTVAIDWKTVLEKARS